MEEDDERDDSKRKSRNLSEKKRRDQFNVLVNELSSMVSSNSRKMDKSTVLKSSIAFLKNHNEVAIRSRVHEIQEDWKPAFLSNEEFTHLILEALDGFIMVFSSSGKICYASESITSLLGHLPNELLTQTIYDLVYEEDQSEIYNILLNPTAISENQNCVTEENKVSFVCYIKRGVFDSKAEISYEYVQFTGYFKNSSESEGHSSRFGGYSGESDTRPIFVGTGRLMTPQLIREMTIVDSTKSEFTSRHSLEWKFLFLDHRAPPIIGYMPFEVLGTSGYDYYHFDDLDKVVVCHDALMQKGEGTSCYYRFLTKGQQWIWLQTRFYITYHQWNSKPEFVVCTHRVVNHADVVRNMRKKDNSNKENDDTDSMQEDSKASSSTSLIPTSPWRGKGSRSRLSQRGSPSSKTRRFNSYGGHGSDTTSNISTESQHSHQSLMTQNSSMSERSRSRHSSITARTSSQSYSQQFPQQAISVAPMSSQMVPHYQREPTTSQMITPFIEPTQYLATIPPLHPSSSYSGNASSPSHSCSEYLHSNVVLTPAQNQIQEHLQRKHEKLQKVIVQQQEELRRVSEQLYITTYGINSTIVNVPLPFSNSTDARYHQSTYNQPQICPAPSAISNMHQLQIPPQIHGQIEHLERIELSQEGSCSEVSYLQLQPVPVSPSHLMPNTLSHHSIQSHLSSNSQQMQGQQGQLQQHQHVNVMTQSEVESTPLQMGQDQAQLLFNSSGHSGRSPSTSRHNQ